MAHSRWWTEHDIALVRQLYADGYSDEVIAPMVQRTISALKDMRRRQGIRRENAGQYNPVSPTVVAKAQDNARACRLHLVDLMRMFSASKKTTLAEAKAEYRACCELDIDPGYRLVTAAIQPYHVARSYVGSQFAD